MNTLPSFSDAFCTELELALTRGGTSLLNAASRGAGLEKARVWADAVAHGVISQEPLLTDPQYGWTVRPDKHAQVHLEGCDLNTNRVVHRFTVRTAQRVSPVKHQNLLLGQSHLVFGRPGDTSWLRASQTVYDGWQREIQQGRLEWNSIDPALVQTWQKTLLSAWKDYLAVGEEASNHAFLDFCLGVNDTYWVHKIARKEQLHMVGVSRTGRLGMPQTSSPVALSGTAELLETDDGIFLEVPMTSGSAIRGFVQDHKNLQGPTVRISWFLEPGQTQGLRLPLETAQTPA